MIYDIVTVDICNLAVFLTKSQGRKSLLLFVVFCIFRDKYLAEILRIDTGKKKLNGGR